MTDPSSENLSTPAAAASAAAPNPLPRPVLLVLCYLGLLGIIPYLWLPQDAEIRWHAKQGLTLTVVTALLFGINETLSYMPLIRLLTPVTGIFLFLGGFGLWLAAVIKALQGQRWPIPGVSDLAEKW